MPVRVETAYPESQRVPGLQVPRLGWEGEEKFTEKIGEGK